MFNSDTFSNDILANKLNGIYHFSELSASPANAGHSVQPLLKTSATNAVDCYIIK
jgi:hypothetical protein